VLARRERSAHVASDAAKISTTADETPDDSDGAPAHEVQGEAAEPTGDVRASPAGEAR
jgi:hypothetical protein